MASRVVDQIGDGTYKAGQQADFDSSVEEGFLPLEGPGDCQGDEGEGHAEGGDDGDA